MNKQVQQIIEAYGCSTDVALWAVFLKTWVSDTVYVDSDSTYIRMPKLVEIRLFDSSTVFSILCQYPNSTRFIMNQRMLNPEISEYELIRNFCEAMISENANAEIIKEFNALVHMTQERLAHIKNEATTQNGEIESIEQSAPVSEPVTGFRRDTFVNRG